MADLSCNHTNRKRSSFTTKHFQRKSLKVFDLHPPLRRLVSIERCTGSTQAVQHSIKAYPNLLVALYSGQLTQHCMYMDSPGYMKHSYMTRNPCTKQQDKKIK